MSPCLFADRVIAQLLEASAESQLPISDYANELTQRLDEIAFTAATGMRLSD